MFEHDNLYEYSSVFFELISSWCLFINGMWITLYVPSSTSAIFFFRPEVIGKAKIIIASITHIKINVHVKYHGAHCWTRQYNYVVHGWKIII